MVQRVGKETPLSFSGKAISYHPKPLLQPPLLLRFNRSDYSLRKQILLICNLDSLDSQESDITASLRGQPSVEEIEQSLSDSSQYDENSVRQVSANFSSSSGSQPSDDDRSYSAWEEDSQEKEWGQSAQSLLINSPKIKISQFLIEYSRFREEVSLSNKA